MTNNELIKIWKKESIGLDSSSGKMPRFFLGPLPLEEPLLGRVDAYAKGQGSGLQPWRIVPADVCVLRRQRKWHKRRSIKGLRMDLRSLSPKRPQKMRAIIVWLHLAGQADGIKTKYQNKKKMKIVQKMSGSPSFLTCFDCPRWGSRRAPPPIHGRNVPNRSFHLHML